MPMKTAKTQGKSVAITIQSVGRMGVRRRESEIDELESIVDKHYGPRPKED